MVIGNLLVIASLVILRRGSTENIEEPFLIASTSDSTESFQPSLV